MTSTNKPITRETSAVYMGRRICIALEEDHLILWPKGTSKRYRLNAAEAYVIAKAKGGRPVRSLKGGEDV